MNSVALVFFTFWLHSPNVTTGPEFSQTLFDTHEECAEFVNTIADDGTQPNVVDENFEFKFASVDGLVFFGGCYTAEQYDEKFLDRS
jgi:hypothetical protein